MDLIPLLNQELDGRYRVCHEVARGGMAVVLLAEDLRHPRNVAIKVLLPELAAVTGTDRFLHEIDTGAALRHPGILPLLDSGSVNGIPFLVMPFVEGETLADRLARERQLPVAETLRLGVEIADALAYAHTVGVVHRDIKPANVMLESGHAVLTDFGIALAIRSVTQDRLTASGASPGSPLYMSPEQAGGSDDLDGRSDVYSLGCVLHEALTGDPPFVGRIPQAIIARKLTEDPPSTRTARDAVSAELDGILRKALARDPGDRFPDAGSFRDALVSVRDGRPGSVAPVAAENEGSVGPSWPATAVWLLSATVAVGFTYLIGMLTSRVHDLTLGVPAEFQPTDPEYMSLGVSAMIPLVVWTVLAVVVFEASRYVARGAVWLLSRPDALRPTVEATRDVIRSSWSTALRRTSSGTAWDVYFLGALLVGIIVLVPYWDFLVAIATGDPGPLTDNAFRRTFSIVLSTVILSLVVVRFALVRHVGTRGGSMIARWGSVAWIVVLLTVTAAPWRLLHQAEAERVRLDGEPGYLLATGDPDAAYQLVFDPARQQVRVVRPGDEIEMERLGTHGYPFEGADAFLATAPPE